MKTNLSIFWFLSILVYVLSSCNPEANWETQDVEVYMTQKALSAGFAEFEFSTNKDAYYLIAICDPWEDYNPVANQKQFMQLALDSAYAQYLLWRNYLLREKEFNVAPFSSHSLQYGKINHFFTGLRPDCDYWVYAFPVDPETMTPAGKLVLENITTKHGSTEKVHFDYRVKGTWDYIYPLDSTGVINNHYPYIATTRDSAEIVGGQDEQLATQAYFLEWLVQMFDSPEYAEVRYGVQVINNNGEESYLEFEEGHTYYTVICGYDFPSAVTAAKEHLAIYKFRWTKNCDIYLHHSGSANILNN